MYHQDSEEVHQALENDLIWKNASVSVRETNWKITPEIMAMNGVNIKPINHILCSIESRDTVALVEANKEEIKKIFAIWENTHNPSQKSSCLKRIDDLKHQNKSYAKQAEATIKLSAILDKWINNGSVFSNIPSNWTIGSIKRIPDRKMCHDLRSMHNVPYRTRHDDFGTTRTRVMYNGFMNKEIYAVYQEAETDFGSEHVFIASPDKNLFDTKTVTIPRINLDPAIFVYVCPDRFFGNSDIQGISRSAWLRLAVWDIKEDLEKVGIV